MLRLWRWLRTALGWPVARPAAVVVPETVYVVAGLYRSAQWFIRWTDEDPKLFRVVLNLDHIRGVRHRPQVIFIEDGWSPKYRREEMEEYLKALQARVTYVSLDELT